MALKLEQKQTIVAEVSQAAEKASSAVLADYRGLTVGQMTEMRSRARASGVYLKVIRNTLAKRALEGTEFRCLEEALVGPTLLAFSEQEPGSAARLLQDCAREFDVLEIKALSVGGQLLAADQINRLATLPTRDQALALLLSAMLAPVTNLTRTLNEVPAKLVRTIAAVRDQKESG